MKLSSKIRFFLVWAVVIVILVIIGISFSKKGTTPPPVPPIASEPMNYSPSPEPDLSPFKE